MAKVALTTLGCKVNQFETETMAGLFRQRGYEIVDFAEKADVYIINTCSVTHLGERKSRQLIRRAGHLNEQAVIAVTGCYAQVAPEEIEKIEGVNAVIGTNERKNIVDIVEKAAQKQEVVLDIKDIMQEHEFEDIPMFGMQSRTRAFLKIQDGCNNFCSYCIIPYARGPLRSRNLDSIKNETQKLIANGFHEIVFSGIHLGAYGKESPENITLADAVKTVLSLNGLKRLRLGSMESIEVADELLELLAADDKFAHHLHLPLQAGHDDVLTAMNRHYTTQEFADLLAKITAKVPDIAITTDIIAGFPGETDEQFAQSLDFIRSLPISRIHAFPYSKRKGTPAAIMENQVDEQIKKQRVHELQKISQEKLAAFEAKFINKTLQVLIEQINDGVADGHTGNYIKVYTDEKMEKGEIYNLKMTKLYKDGLWGTKLF
ncbi:tRNA (N(6)-L-threonylcarbamoyladenosine(37)-C(2))-methylthiotransferase MtaB [Pectinatus brassicae]|uniref:Threonylcarbamoyladenosine tRNA methylthiotransferase MtaB n=1 Tax=Pectinatus brassicae TaxID=862415 RepID=A0A840USU1_9FIRM|nr:tRNA (N(6)-L-threonylcarbamoyladenosine(37)-C(2))-methylthiotransferase MtaB [Pectinatus brassicae]MBB5335575.1 threonylcarbamoyladenosine tRNA methylthiotransferase MtaB [Pectinatus brassicae]